MGKTNVVEPMLYFSYTDHPRGKVLMYSARIVVKINTKIKEIS